MVPGVVRDHRATVLILDARPALRGRRDAGGHLRRAGSDPVRVGGPVDGANVLQARSGHGGDSGERARARRRALDDVVGHARGGGPRDRDRIVAGHHGGRIDGARRTGVQRLGELGDDRDGGFFGGPRVVRREHQLAVVDLRDGVVTRRGLRLIEAGTDVVAGQVFEYGDRRDAHVPERTVVRLAHLAGVPHDLRGNDDVAVVGVGLDERVAQRHAARRVRDVPVVDVHHAVAVAVERGLVHVDGAPHVDRRVLPYVRSGAADPDLFAREPGKDDRVLEGIVLERTHRLEEGHAPRDGVVGAGGVGVALRGRVRDRVVVVDEQHLLVLPVVHLAGHDEDEVLPRLRLAPATRNGRRVTFAMARVSPLRALVLEVLGRVSVGRRGREHRVAVARQDREGLTADDDRVLAREILHHLEPARLTGRREDLRDQRVERGGC